MSSLDEPSEVIARHAEICSILGMNDLLFDRQMQEFTDAGFAHVRLTGHCIHNFTTQSPHEVWIAVGQKAWAPKLPSPSIRLVRMSGQALHFGVEEHRIAGTIIGVFNPAKTVADCFKFRNKIGIEVAIEALKESHKTKKATMGVALVGQIGSKKYPRLRT